MSGNTFGTLFTVTSFGESHGPAIGCVVDGCPPGLDLCAADIQGELDRRKPGTSRHVTQRREPDAVEILSGVFEGRTTGTPIALLIRNQDQRSKDYGNIADTFRPGHADYTYTQKYGFRDHRGGGRSSARETAVRVAAGAIARKWLRERYGIGIRGWMSALGPIEIPFVAARRHRRQCLLRAQCAARAATGGLHGRLAQVAGFGRSQDHSHHDLLVLGVDEIHILGRGGHKVVCGCLSYRLSHRFWPLSPRVVASLCLCVIGSKRVHRVYRVSRVRGVLESLRHRGLPTLGPTVVAVLSACCLLPT